jgi:hypothetical protein
MTHLLNTVLEREGLTLVSEEEALPVEVLVNEENAVQAMARSGREGICPACAHDAVGDFIGVWGFPSAEFTHCPVCDQGYANTLHPWSKHNIAVAVSAVEASQIVRNGADAAGGNAGVVSEFNQRSAENKAVSALELSIKAGVCSACAFDKGYWEDFPDVPEGGGLVSTCAKCESVYPNPSNRRSTHNVAAAVSSLEEALRTRAAEGLVAVAVATVAMQQVLDSAGERLSVCRAADIQRQVIELVTEQTRGADGVSRSRHLCFDGGRAVRSMGFGWGSAPRKRLPPDDQDR